MFFILRPEKPIEERAYDAAVNWVNQDLINQDPTFCEYDAKYVKAKGSYYMVEVRVEMTNVYLVTKEYIYDVQVNVVDGSCVAYTGMRRLEETE